MASPSAPTIEEDDIRKRYGVLYGATIMHRLIKCYSETVFVEALNTDLGRHPVEAYCGGSSKTFSRCYV